MTWHAGLELAARRDDSGRCTVHARHQGPLRVLKTLYPEGDAIAHQVIVHPPGGIVGGDRLDIELALQPHTHTVVTTPGATRFYRSDGRDAAQVVLARVGAHARLEWLPLETLVHSGCLAENRVQFELDDGAQLIGWDVVALGLPAAGERFAAGRFTQQVQWPGHWLERGVIDGSDTRLLRMSSFLVDYPFASRLYPAALDAIRRLRAEGLTVILSDGDVVFQPLKIERSGLWAAVEGRVLIYIHKEEMLDAVAALYPAERYVMIDDKLRILAAMKKTWQNRLTTIFVRQGHYALDPRNIAAYPPADMTIEHIGDLVHSDLATLRGNAAAARAQQEES